MVQAILANRKTQTRRVVKMKEPFPRHDSWPVMELARDGMPIFWSSQSPQNICDSDYYEHGMPCPYGQIGDRLWVKEGLCTTRRDGPILYAADQKTVVVCGKGDNPWIWKRQTQPGMFCPRWASRITQEITAIRVERLNVITQADAQAEGFEHGEIATARDHFYVLWDKINGKRHPLKSNPWVWCITFRRCGP